MAARSVARLGVGLLQVYLTDREALARGCRGYGLMGPVEVVSERLAVRLGRHADDLDLVIAEVEGEGLVRVWRLPEPDATPEWATAQED